MTNNEARELWAKTGLKYQDLTSCDLQRLRNLVNEEMKNQTHIKKYRCKQRWVRRENFANLRCKAFYFDDRECISFNPDGFVGFAGWSDSTNVQPILNGFKAWINTLEMSKAALS